MRHRQTSSQAIQLRLVACVIAIGTSLLGTSVLGTELCSRLEWSEATGVLTTDQNRDRNSPSLVLDHSGTPHLFYSRVADDKSRFLLNHAIYQDHQWFLLPHPSWAQPGFSDWSPDASVSSDNSIAICWLRRYGPGDLDSAILVTRRASDGGWESPYIIEGVADKRTSYTVVSASADSTLVAYSYSTGLAYRWITSDGISERRQIQPLQDLAGAWRVTSLQRESGQILVFWTSLGDVWPHFEGHYAIIPRSEVTTAASPLPSPNGADFIAVGESSDGVVHVTYSNSLNGGQAIGMLWTQDAENWDGPLRVAGYDGGRNCGTSNVVAGSAGSVRIFYSCETQLPDGSYGAQRYDVYSKDFRPPTGFCPEQYIVPEPTIATYERVYPAAVSIGGAEQLVVYAEGPQIVHTLKHARILRSIGVASPTIGLTTSQQGSVFARFENLTEVPGLYAVLEFSESGNDNWTQIELVHIPMGHEYVHEFVVDRRPGWYRASLRSFASGAAIAVSPTEFFDDYEPLQLSLVQGQGSIEACLSGTAQFRKLDIINLAGRTIATHGSLGQVHCMTIPLADRNGRGIANGVYLIRAEIETVGGRVVRTRQILVQ